MDSSRCVLHGGWIPADSDGQFVVWAEAFAAAERTFSALAGKKPNGGKSGRSARLKKHPFCLKENRLSDVFKEYSKSAGTDLEPTQVSVFLPSAHNCPVPSLELQDEVNANFPMPEIWQQWTVEALSIGDSYALLDSIDGLLILPEIVIGNDLRFWVRLSGRLTDAVRQHDYLPAIFPSVKIPKASVRKSTTARRRMTANDLEFAAGWELTDSALESIVSTFSAVMPAVCRTLSWRHANSQRKSQQVEPQMLNAEGLVWHFVTQELNRRVRSTRLPVGLCMMFQDPFPGSALLAVLQNRRMSYRFDGLSDSVTQTDWQQWRRWRNQINRSEAETDERICFRLNDPNPEYPNAWQLEWLLSSRRDPSYQTPLAKFWESRPQARSVREVLLQLGQAARLYERLWDGMNSAAPDCVVLTRGEALNFLRYYAAVLQGAGFRVIVPSWWTVSGQRRLRLQMRARSAEREKGAGTESQGILSMNAVISWQPSVVMDGVPLTETEWEEIVRTKEGLVYMRGQWMELSAGDIDVLEQYWQEEAVSQETSLRELLHIAADPHREVVYEDDLADAMEAFRDSEKVALRPQPDTLSGELRNYQVRGFSWLVSLENLGFGACLADDMGLGKTIQVLATLLCDKAESQDFGPTLLVAPTSLLGNWQSEAGIFSPSLKTMIHHGGDRSKTAKTLRKAIEGMDLVIASYGVARRDRAILNTVSWRRLVVDEAQNIKNPTAAITKALAAIPAQRRIALTGTPVENRLLDLWSIFNIVNPGFLGNVTEFRKEYERPIMRNGDKEATVRLRELVKPFILRRLKSDRSIISDLPDKIEQNAQCSLTTEQATLYEAVLREVENNLTEEEGIERQGIMLSAIMRLKQICNHPAQFLQDGSEFSHSRSHKLARVCDMLEEVQAANECALVFTQFTEIGKSLQILLRARLGCQVFYLYGGTPMGMRQHMVDSFQNQNSGPAVFVLSLRAAGVGLTLTRANHVIHFDRWWNPAVENQATDRAYRIGQSKVVMVHKMVTLGTLEEKIDRLIETKKQLAEEVVGTGESWLSDMGNDEFKALISLDRSNAAIA